MDGQCERCGRYLYDGTMYVEIERLRAELEIERSRLAACGVVAWANTPASAIKARKILPEYMSASCEGVARAVDREMALRTENTGLLTDLNRVLTTLRYLIGIAERGEGRPMAEEETAESFVLGYVKRLEAELAAAKRAIKALFEFASTVAPSSSWWDDTWPEHEVTYE